MGTNLVEVKFFRFWPKSHGSGEGTELLGVLTEIDNPFRGPFYSPMKCTVKMKFLNSALLEMYFSVGTFLVEVNIFRFCPKTMDYSQGF